MTPELSIGRFELARLAETLVPLERGLRAIPEDRLAERPVPGAWPIGLLIAHIYEVVHVTLLGVKLGACTEADVADIPAAEAVADSRQGLLARAETLRGWVGEFRHQLSDEQVSRQVRYYFGAEARGLDAINLAYAELLHHRGQVQSYLRLMGIEPPDIYDTTPSGSA